MPSILYSTPNGPQQVNISQLEADAIMKVANAKTSFAFVRIGADVVNVAYIQAIFGWDDVGTSVGNIVPPPPPPPQP